MGGALVASAILITNRWQVHTSGGVILKLDRWTGSAELCEESDYGDGVGPLRCDPRAAK
jgi:hypothetical protein